MQFEDWFVLDDDDDDDDGYDCIEDFDSDDRRKKKKWWVPYDSLKIVRKEPLCFPGLTYWKHRFIKPYSARSRID